MILKKEMKLWLVQKKKALGNCKLNNKRNNEKSFYKMKNKINIAKNLKILKNKVRGNNQRLVIQCKIKKVMLLNNKKVKNKL